MYMSFMYGQTKPTICIAKSLHIVEVMYEVWYCACFK